VLVFRFDASPLAPRSGKRLLQPVFATSSAREAFGHDKGGVRECSGIGNLLRLGRCAGLECFLTGPAPNFSSGNGPDGSLIPRRVRLAHRARGRDCPWYPVHGRVTGDRQPYLLLGRIWMSRKNSVKRDQQSRRADLIPCRACRGMLPAAGSSVGIGRLPPRPCDRVSSCSCNRQHETRARG